LLKEGLYAVITEKFCKGRSSEDVLKQVIAAGVKLVQLREKELSKKELYPLAKKFREITLKNQVTLIINDHLDIALAVKADGVHLGQDDLPCSVARKIAPHLICGVSTHNVSEALEAQAAGASYINIGPLFSTQTKETGIPPLGLETLIKIKEKINLPCSVMGGIKENNLDELLKIGAKRIAMVTEITQADDIAKKAGRMQKKILNYNNRCSILDGRF